MEGVGKEKMRRSVLLLITMAAALLLASGVALAATVKGTSGNDDPLEGTEKTDNILPYNGDDVVNAYGGDDTVHHSFGNDTIYGGPGNDTLRGGRGGDKIYGGDGADLIDCASLESRGDTDTDIAYADSLDTVVDCPEPYLDDPTSSEPPLAS